MESWVPKMWELELLTFKKHLMLAVLVALICWMKGHWWLMSWRALHDNVQTVAVEGLLLVNLSIQDCVIEVSVAQLGHCMTGQFGNPCRRSVSL